MKPRVRLWMGVLVGVAVWATALGGTEYTAPAGHYASAEGLMGEALRLRLSQIATSGAQVVSYADLWQTLRVLDEDPSNPDNLILIYSGESVSKSSQGEGGNSWNREHTWPQSYGASTGPANSDMHHLFPCRANVNSQRSNNYFDDLPHGVESTLAPGNRLTADAWEPRDADKGMIARAMFYMEARYEPGNPSGDFRLSNRPNASNKTMARLDALLRWNRAFPPTSYERRRNHLIHNGVVVGTRTYRQGNRNPYIDYPDLVDAVFTHDLYLTPGAWRVEHFSFPQMDDPEVSGNEADPDGDGLINFLEMAFGLDPLTADHSLHPTLSTTTDGRVRIEYRRAVNPEPSGLSYAVEYQTGHRQDWVVYDPLPGEEEAHAEGVMARVRLHPEGLPDVSELSFRLRVSMAETGLRPAFEASVPLGEPITRPRRLFEDLEPNGDGLKLSPWFGLLLDSAYPILWHLNHEWIYVVGEDETSVWFYDFGTAGWFWTGSTSFPYLYRADRERWLLFFDDSARPNRFFYDFISEDLVPEQDLLGPMME